MAEYKSERTKKLEEAKVDEDMTSVKQAVKKGAIGISRAIDKVEGLFKKEEKKMARGGAVKSMKMCKGCPTPAKCKAAGKCLAKKDAAGSSVARKGAAGMLVIPVKMNKTTATKYAGAGKKKAKK